MYKIYSISLLVLLSIVNASFAQDKVLYSGTLEADSYFTTFKGTWQIVERDDQTIVILGDNFEAKKAPDLKIFLSSLPFEDIDADNASSETSSQLVAELKKYKGTATYIVPEGVDLTKYQSIIIHCEKYAKLWGGSSLK